MKHSQGSWASLALSALVVFTACGESPLAKKTSKASVAPKPANGGANNAAANLDADIVPVNCASITPDATVIMQDLAFSPARVEIENGDTVRWINRDSVPHSATSGSPDIDHPGTAFDSGEMASGQSVCYRFHTVGEFTYFCTVHPEQMRDAVIAVRKSGGDDGEDEDEDFSMLGGN